MMRNSLYHALKELKFGSMDAPGKGAVHRFLASGRIGLWPAIFLSTFAFSRLLHYEVGGTVAVATTLCLTASIGFLFNDALDTDIDQANGIHRWALRTRLDSILFGSAIGAFALALAVSALVVSAVATVCLGISLLVAFAYSLFCKKILLLGNVVAAALSMSPGLIMLTDAALTTHRSASIWFPSAMFILIGFLLLLSREIRFDEFDRAGDRKGQRTTLPMLLGRTALNIAHALLVTSSLVLLLATLCAEAKFPGVGNVALGLTITTISAVLCWTAYRSASKNIFYKTTRVAMLAVPGGILLGFW
jgi:4-hydroxybenzoate polyprenyltransferase